MEDEIEVKPEDDEKKAEGAKELLKPSLELVGSRYTALARVLVDNADAKRILEKFC